MKTDYDKRCMLSSKMCKGITPVEEKMKGSGGNRDDGDNERAGDAHDCYDVRGFAFHCHAGKTDGSFVWICAAGAVRDGMYLYCESFDAAFSIWRDAWLKSLYTDCFRNFGSAGAYCSLCHKNSQFIVKNQQSSKIILFWYGQMKSGII